jgi:hypothetical protein
MYWYRLQIKWDYKKKMFRVCLDDGKSKFLQNVDNDAPD